MQPDVLATCLLPAWKSELVGIGCQVSDAIKMRRRSVRDHALLRPPFPYGCFWGQLQPGRAKRKMFWLSTTTKPVHAMRHSFEAADPHLA
ncbi:MAG: hypothetical protein Q4B02_11655 [Propionibacteriaceae bacterium]|nr:hypothetical protein [Propionibacteriaceae bacterium]